MSNKLKKAIGAVKDHTSIRLAKATSNNTSNLEVALLKATTHDDIPIDDRYVHEILILVSSNKIYAAACARAIGNRIGRTRNWIVALKSLMLVLRIFQDGDPYFPREVLHSMKRGAKILNLSSFRDDSNSSPWDFTAYVRTFSLYLDERLDCFLTGKLQRRYSHKVRDQAPDNKIKRRNEPVRDMKPVMLLDRISYWQRLLERAIATRPTGAAKTNRLVQISLYSVVQESFILYKDISDGLALLLDSFFHLQYQNCVSAFQACIKAAKQFEELSAFYSLCKNIGVGRTSEYPSVQTVSKELLETLQEFLKDQSSFPATNTRPPNRIMLLPAPQIINSKSGRHDSYGAQSDFSDMTSTDNESSHCTSLEELISATEVAVTIPSISIDLEDYSDQFEEVHAQRDRNLNRLSASGSTQSLPVLCSIGDFISLDDWPIHEENEQYKQQQNQEKIAKGQGPETSSIATGWELVLAESITTTQSSSATAFSEPITTEQLANTPKPPIDTFTAFPEPITTDQLSKPTEWEHAQKIEEILPSTLLGSGWELDLVVPPRTSSQPTTPKQAQKIDEICPLNPSVSGWELDLVTMPPSQQSIAMEQTRKIEEIFPPTPSGTGWELALLSPQPTAWEQAQKFEEIRPPTPSGTGWELALVVPPSPKPAPNTFTTSNDLDHLFNVNPNPSNHYNPFLQDATELTPTPDFQVGFPSDANNSDDFLASFAQTDLSATPTFSAQNPNSDMVAPEIQNDPFAAFSSSDQNQLFSGSINQQNLLHERQLWLQNQSKIIAKHIA